MFITGVADTRNAFLLKVEVSNSSNTAPTAQIIAFSSATTNQNAGGYGINSGVAINQSGTLLTTFSTYDSTGFAMPTLFAFPSSFILGGQASQQPAIMLSDPKTQLMMSEALTTDTAGNFYMATTDLSCRRR